MRNPRISTVALSLTVGAFVFSGLLLLLLLGVVWATSPEILTVTNTNDAGPGSLRQAMLEALPQDEIRFDPSLSEQTISLTSGEIRLDRAVTIDATDTLTLTISAGGNSRVFFVNGSGVTVRNLILADGNGIGATYPPADGYGGCIYVTSSTSLNLEGVEVRDCQAQFGGGAIANFYSTLDCTDCSLHDNEVLNPFGFGGAVYNFAGFGLASTVTISNSLILSNTAASGGGVTNDGNGDPAHAMVYNSFVGQNRATGSGGAFFNVARQQGQMALVMGSELPDPVLLLGTNPYVSDKTDPSSTAFVRDARLVLDRTFVAGNEAAVSCGGICNVGDFHAVNTMISANKAMTGGAIVNGDQLNIDWTTLAFNEAGFGNAIAYSDVFGLGAQIAVNDSLLWNPESGSGAQRIQQETDNECFADEGVGTTSLNGSGNIFSAADCSGQIAGQVKDPKLVPINNNVYILGEGNEVSDTNSKERPGDKDIVEVSSKPPQAPGAQGHGHFLTIRKETIPPSDISFEFSAIQYFPLNDEAKESWLLADGESYSIPILTFVEVSEKKVDSHTVKVVCTPAINVTGPGYISVHAEEAQGDGIDCVFLNILHGSITIKKMIPGGIVPPEVPFSFTLATHSEQLAGFGLGPGEEATFNKLVPDEYFASEVLIPDGWVLEDVTCDAIDYRRTNDTTAPGVAINLQLGEDVTCEFQNEWLSGTQTPTPTASPTASPTPSPTPTATPEVPDPNAPNLVPLAIEVNQAVQDLNNSTPLIALKQPSYVRVYFRSDKDNIPNIDARLFSNRYPESLTPFWKETAHDHDITLMDRDEVRKGAAFLFALPPHWTHAGATTLTVEINQDRSVKESDYSDNMESVTVNFEPMPALSFLILPIRDNVTARTGSLDEYGNQIRFLLNTYPIASTNFIYGPRLERPLNLASEAGLAEFDQILKQWIATANHPTLRPIVFGLVHPEVPSAVEGTLARTVGKVVENGTPALWGKPGELTTLAHETGHALGRLHINCDLPSDHPKDASVIDLSYPEPRCQYAKEDIEEFRGISSIASQWAVPKVPPPFGSADFMSYRTPPWVSNHTYSHLKTIIKQRHPTNLNAASFEMGTHLVVSGLIDTTANTGEINDIYQLSEPSSILESGSDGYILETQDAASQTLLTHAFGPVVPVGTKPGSEVFAFVETLDLPVGAVRVVLKQGDTILDERVASANPPTVILTTPNGGESLAGIETIEWGGDDADDDTLVYVLQYSSDGGQSWLSLDVGSRDTSFELDTMTIAGGNHSLVRVLVSDGFHTAMDQSDTTFVVKKKPPEAMILQEGGLVVPPNVPFSLIGLGIDYEDGTVADDALIWSSDRDGQLGSGQQVLISTLSPGWHTITMIVTDSDGNQASDGIDLYIGTRLYLPTILAD